MRLVSILTLLFTITSAYAQTTDAQIEALKKKRDEIKQNLENAAKLREFLGLTKEQIDLTQEIGKATEKLNEDNNRLVPLTKVAYADSKSNFDVFHDYFESIGLHEFLAIPKKGSMRAPTDDANNDNQLLIYRNADVSKEVCTINFDYYYSKVTMTCPESNVDALIQYETSHWTIKQNYTTYKVGSASYWFQFWK